MAANCARRSFRFPSASAKTLVSVCRRSSSPVSSRSSGATSFGGFAAAMPTSPRHFSRRKLSFLSRLPVELGCAQSLMPLHTVNASALLTSMLSIKGGNWGWLSEGFATPL